MSFLGLGLEDVPSLNLASESHLSLLQSSELSEEGHLLELGGDLGLFSGHVSRFHDLLDGCVGLGNVTLHVILGGHDGSSGFLQGSFSFGDSLLGVSPAFVSSTENSHC